MSAGTQNKSSNFLSGPGLPGKGPNSGSLISPGSGAVLIDQLLGTSEVERAEDDNAPHTSEPLQPQQPDLEDEARQKQ